MKPEPPAVTPRFFRFVAAAEGRWRVASNEAIAGAALAAAPRLAVLAAGAPAPADALWTLRGATSNERYVGRGERAVLVARQEALGRAAATRAALIPIRKSVAWWMLAQDERREILEERSHHIAIGARYLPAIARRLHHCRDLGPDEPFDFLTWFEYAPEHEAAFDELVAALRASPEWAFVEREVDLRLVDDAGPAADARD